MILRCWVLVGTAPNFTLPEGNHLGTIWGNLPEATGYRPGDWINWMQTPSAFGITLVCVELPL